MRESFWSGGSSEYLKALQIEEERKLRDLQVRLAAELAPSAREALLAEMARVRQEYRQRPREARRSLFAGDW